MCDQLVAVLPVLLLPPQDAALAAELQGAAAAASSWPASGAGPDLAQCDGAGSFLHDMSWFMYGRNEVAGGRWAGTGGDGMGGSDRRVGGANSGSGPDPVLH